MSNHTPEPWNGKRIDIAVHYFESINAEIALTGKSDEAMANARRIVACVNACRGLSTDELEQHGLVSAVGYELIELTKQRDELLEALEEVTEYAEMAMEQANKAGSEWEIGYALYEAKMAIAKSKGGAA